MKITNFLLAGLVAFAFTACNNDVEDQLGPNDQGKEVKGYLSVAIKNSPVKSTRTAPGSEGTENGVGNENAINTITVILTNSSNEIEQILPVTNFSGGVTEAFEVTTGSYLLYTLINMPSEVTPVVGQAIQEVISFADATYATSGFKSSSFLMVNEKHDQTSNAGVPVTITSANSKSNPAKSTVNVDRVAVKIVQKTNPALTAEIVTTPAGAIVGATIEGYLLLNVNKQFNLIQDWGTANTNYANYPDAGAPATVTEALQTPLFTSGLIMDQYFYNISTYTTLHKEDNTNPDSITRIEDLTINGGVPFLTMDTPVFATENRPTIMTFGTNQPTAGRAETTGIIYKVQATDGANPLPTFYFYNGRVYTDRAALNAAFFPTEDISSINDNTVLRAKGIKVYENGIMYYTYFIKGTNDNANHRFNGLNYFGVFRNSVYNLTVNKFTALGDDVPGGGTVDPTDPTNPNPPIDTDEAYIVVTVNVNDWVLNEIGIDF